MKLGGGGSDSLSAVNIWKETSVLSLFRPSFCPGPARSAPQAAGPSPHVFILASSDFCLLSLSQPFRLTLLYLADIFG